MTSVYLSILFLSLGHPQHAQREAASKAVDRLGSFGYAIAERYLFSADGEIASRCHGFIATFHRCVTCGGEGPCGFCAGSGVWRNN